MKYLRKIFSSVSATSNNGSDENSYICLKKGLIFGKILGIVPLQNLRSNQCKEIRFSWLSVQVFYSIIIFIFYVFFSALLIITSIKTKLFLKYAINILFHVNVAVAFVLFIQFSQKWPNFIVKLSNLEENLKKYKSRTNLSWKLNIITVIVNITAIAEHVLSSFVYMYQCNFDLESYTNYRYEFVFRNLNMKYKTIFGIILLVLNWIGLFIWNFSDFFIMLLSIVMTEKFSQINKGIKKFLDKASRKKIININDLQNEISASSTYTHFWKEVREDYLNASKVCWKLDELLSHIVVSCYMCNLLFILLQLFFSLRERDTVLESIYFFYSFLFVIIRTIAVSIYGGLLNEESQSSVKLLVSVPSEIYNVEIYRLLTQINVYPVALTGRNFFTLRRGLVISIAAAVITYELVFIQFYQASGGIQNGLNGTYSTCN